MFYFLFYPLMFCLQTGTLPGTGRAPGSSQVNTLSIVLSRKVDCDVCERVAKLKITLKLAVAPSSLNTLLKNVPVLSEAFWNKPVDRVLLGVSYAWWF